MLKIEEKTKLVKELEKKKIYGKLRSKKQG